MKYLISTFLIMVTCLVAACSKEAPPEEKVARPVKYIEVVYANTGKVRTFSGTSKTDQVIQLSFRSAGVLSDLNIKLGQRVKEGQLLAKLDNLQARLNYQNALSSQNSTESQMRTAKLSLDRTRALFEKGGSSLSDYESAKNSYRTAKQSYQSAIRTAEIQKDQIQYGYLYAPSTGVIASVNVEVNENLGVGQAVATLNAGQEMEIVLGLPESVINLVKKNMAVKVDFPSIANTQFDGSVSEVSPALDAATATYPVTVVLDVPNETVKSGMSANVTFDFEQLTDAKQKQIIAPAPAVGEDASGQFVFKLVKQNEEVIVKKTKVTIGELTPKGFEVLSGIAPGDLIATAGLQTLLDGQSVRLK